jgi:hypothetical protein
MSDIVECVFQYGKLTLKKSYNRADEPADYERLEYNLQSGKLEFLDRNSKIIKELKPNGE